MSVSEEEIRHKIILSIMKFALGEVTNEEIALSEDSRESVEVAVQCLESAYGIDRKEASVGNVPDLLELFSSTSEIWFEDLEQAEEVDVQPTAANKEEANKLKSLGNTFMVEEKFIEAIDSYTKAIKLDPKNAIFYCNRAAAYSKLNDHAKAIRDCQVAIKLSPTYSKAYGRLGIAYSSLNDHESARKAYLRALELEPGNESYKNNLQLTVDQLQKMNSTSSAKAAGSSDFAAGLGGNSPNSPQLPSGFDIRTLMNNPTLMNMASQMLNNSNMQNILNGLMTMRQEDSNVDALLMAGQELAQQMTSANPELVENLRRQMSDVVDANNANSDTDPGTEGHEEP